MERKVPGAFIAAVTWMAGFQTPKRGEQNLFCGLHKRKAGQPFRITPSQLREVGLKTRTKLPAGNLISRAQIHATTRGVAPAWKGYTPKPSNGTQATHHWNDHPRLPSGCLYAHPAKRPSTRAGAFRPVRCPRISPALEAPAIVVIILTVDKVSPEPSTHPPQPPSMPLQKTALCSKPDLAPARSCGTRAPAHEIPAVQCADIQFSGNL